MTGGIILLVCLIIICLIGVIQAFIKEDTGFFTFLGCWLGFWLSLILLVKFCEKCSKESKQEIPIEQIESIEQVVDTIPINIKIIVEYE